jgi:hypothetical protein
MQRLHASVLHRRRTHAAHARAHLRDGRERDADERREAKASAHGEDNAANADEPEAGAGADGIACRHDGGGEHADSKHRAHDERNVSADAVFDRRVQRRRHVVADTQRGELRVERAPRALVVRPERLLKPVAPSRQSIGLLPDNLLGQKPELHVRTRMRRAAASRVPRRSAPCG